MDPATRRFWKAIQLDPRKWQQHPWGDEGGGFWVVGVLGQRVLWYNDIEDGFNVSEYSEFGTIDHYGANQSELQNVVASLRVRLDAADE